MMRIETKPSERAAQRMSSADSWRDSALRGGAWAIRAIATVAVGCAATLPAPVASAAEPPARPNIIYVLADDLGYGDLGCYGQDKIRTPAIDRLAAEGIRFTQHYAASTVCAPTRCCLMTGVHTGHATIRGNAKVALARDDVTIAEVLKSAGYATACVGKWGLGDADTSGAPWRQGFDFFFGYLDQTNAHFYYPPFLWRNDAKVQYPENDRAKRRGRYSHDLMTEEALGFIRAHADQPFFLYLAYTIPHAENTVPDDSLAEYLGQFPEQAHSDSHYGVTEHPRASYAGMITRMDRDVGRIMALLKELGLDERTIVFFSSDNGPSKEAGPTVDFFDSNGPFRGIKRDLYEGGIRVPLIARWPDRIAPNQTSDLITAQWDVLPTVAELAGVKPPAATDGVSIIPTLLGRPGQQAPHTALYWEFFEQDGKQAVRMGKWKGIRLNVSRDPAGPIELYDLDADPGEVRNVANQHPEVVTRIAQVMASSRTDSPHFAFGVRRLPPTATLPRSAWHVVRVDSESRHNGAIAAKAFDGDPRTHWHTQWRDGAPPHPHELVIDLGAEHRIRGFRYLPRATGRNGTIGKFEFFVGNDREDFGAPVASGAFTDPFLEQEVEFSPVRGRYVCLRALSCIAGTPYTSCAELNVLPADEPGE